MPDGFVDMEDGIFKGKGLSALKLSKEGRNKLIAFFGGPENLPSSILVSANSCSNRRISDSADEIAADRSYEKSSAVYARKRELGSLYWNFNVSGRGAKSGALSRFPQNVGRTVLLFYTNPGDVVFDPFAGHNSRMDLCVTNGRHYIGCDLSTEFMEFNFQRADVLRQKYPSANIVLHHCDSRRVPVGSRSADFTITSPPYWDIEYYGDEAEQLGKRKTYNGFLNGLKKVLRENHRVLKPGAFAAWFVNDFRREGKMYFYHSDLIRLGEQVGFVAHDILIVDLGRSMRDCFINQAVQQRIIPKRHEYAIIFRKIAGLD